MPKVYMTVRGTGWFNELNHDGPVGLNEPKRVGGQLDHSPNEVCEVESWTMSDHLMLMVDAVPRGSREGTPLQNHRSQNPS